MTFPDTKAADTWMGAGTAIALALAVLLWFLRRRRAAVWAFGVAAACAERWRDVRLSNHVHDLLARSGRDA